MKTDIQLLSPVELLETYGHLLKMPFRTTAEQNILANLRIEILARMENKATK